MRQHQFPVVIEYDPTEKVFLAECPMLPGCYTDGETYEEALTNIRDAIQLVIESRQAVGDPVRLSAHPPVEQPRHLPSS